MNIIKIQQKFAPPNIFSQPEKDNPAYIEKQIKELLPQIVKLIRNYPHGSLPYLLSLIDNPCLDRREVKTKHAGMCADMANRIIELLVTKDIYAYPTQMERDKNGRHVAVIVPLKGEKFLLLDDDALSEDPKSVFVIDKNNSEQFYTNQNGEIFCLSHSSEKKEFYHLTITNSKKEVRNFTLCPTANLRYPHLTIFNVLSHRPDIAGVLVRARNTLSGKNMFFIAVDFDNFQVTLKEYGEGKKTERYSIKDFIQKLNAGNFNYLLERKILINETLLQVKKVLENIKLIKYRLYGVNPQNRSLLTSSLSGLKV